MTSSSSRCIQLLLLASAFSFFLTMLHFISFKDYRFFCGWLVGVVVMKLFLGHYSSSNNKSLTDFLECNRKAAHPTTQPAKLTQLHFFCWSDLVCSMLAIHSFVCFFTCENPYIPTTSCSFLHHITTWSSLVASSSQDREKQVREKHKQQQQRKMKRVKGSRRKYFGRKIRKGSWLPHPFS